MPRCELSTCERKIVLSSYLYTTQSANAVFVVVVVVVVDVCVCVQRMLYVLSCLWDGAYKRSIAANRKQ